MERLKKSSRKLTDVHLSCGQCFQNDTFMKKDKLLYIILNLREIYLIRSVKNNHFPNSNVWRETS